MKSGFQIYSMLLISIAALVFSGCAELEDEIDVLSRDERNAIPSSEYIDAIMTHTESGDTTFKLISPEIYRYDKPERAVLEGGIEVYFYTKGLVTSTLTAERGEVTRSGRDLFAEGNVIVESDSGATIYTPRIFWSRRTHKVTSDTIVTIISEYDTLYGVGFIATDDMKDRRILKPTGISHRQEMPGSSEKKAVE